MAGIPPHREQGDAIGRLFARLTNELEHTHQFSVEGQNARATTARRRAVLARLNRRLEPRCASISKPCLSPEHSSKTTGRLASLRSLPAKKLLGEVSAAREDVVWREDSERGRLALIITPAGMAAIAVAAAGDEEGPPAPAERVAASPRLPRAGSKLALLVATLRQPPGRDDPRHHGGDRVAGAFGSGKHRIDAASAEAGATAPVR